MAQMRKVVWNTQRLAEIGVLNQRVATYMSESGIAVALLVSLLENDITQGRYVVVFDSFGWYLFGYLMIGYMSVTFMYYFLSADEI